MIHDADRAAIEASVEALGVEQWRGLDSEERDRVRRALAPHTPVREEMDAA